MLAVEAEQHDEEGNLLLEGARIGNYVLKERIGRGGMGEVWRAEHPDIGRVVAIKILNADSATHKESVERFFFEARAANRTRHPNLIDIVDLGSLPGTGQCYCVMEYLQGKDLSETLRIRGKIPFEEALPWFVQMLEALQAVHDQGILHRDLKPENIFLTDDPHRGTTLKILDFGVAKLIRASQDLTRVGIAMGTPMFMSPEQASGQKLDTRSDLYAVGVLLYVVITGRYPFTGSTPTRILEKTVNDAPIPPSQVLPDIQPELETFILKSLEKEKENRYPSAREMLTALKALVSEKPNSVTAAAGQLIARPPEKSKRAAIFVSAVGALLVAALGFVFFGAESPKAVPATQPAPQAYMLTLQARPENAQVFRGEMPLGFSPGPFLVTPGETLRVQAPSFQDMSLRVPAAGPMEVNLVASPAPATAEVLATQPSEPVLIEPVEATKTPKNTTTKIPKTPKNTTTKIPKKPKGPIGGLGG